MLDRQGGDILFECDSCPAVLETNTADFNSARNLMRREGWTVRKEGTDWVHFCDSCSQQRKSK